MLLVLIIVVLLKSLFWTFSIPIWQGPDEQAHFSQLQYYNEKQTLSLPDDFNLSKQVLVSEELLGTKRDSRGNNQYTYHPDYRILYTKSLYGPYEAQINFNYPQLRQEMVYREIAHYPPLYYLLASPLYQSASQNGKLIDMLYIPRLLSILIGLILAIVAYKTGLVIVKDKYLAICVAGMVSFQPMNSFVLGSFHPDNLLNLIYSLAVLVLLLILKNGLRFKYLLMLVVLIFLGIKTKELMILFLPLSFAVIVFKLFRESRVGFIFSVLVLLAPVFVMTYPSNLSLPYLPGVPLKPALNFVEYLQFRIPKLFFEIWPWYWGVFKWLGVTLSPIPLKIVTRIFAISMIGLAVGLALKFVRKQMDFQFKAILLLVSSSLSYMVYLLLWDFRIMQKMGFSQGIQGRYFFPNIVGHMVLVLLGLTFFLPNRGIISKRNIGIVVFLLMILLNFSALDTLLNSYYDLSTLNSFIIQFAQYKPEIVKYIASLIINI